MVDGDLVAALRAHEPPVIARSREGVTSIDLRAVPPSADEVIVAALQSVAGEGS